MRELRVKEIIEKKREKIRKMKLKTIKTEENIDNLKIPKLSNRFHFNSVNKIPIHHKKCRQSLIY